VTVAHGVSSCVIAFGGLAPAVSLCIVSQVANNWPFSSSQQNRADVSACLLFDHLCGLVVRVLDYRSRGPGSIPGDEVEGLQRGPLSLVSTVEELTE
jgi:hypothetical protein